MGSMLFSAPIFASSVPDCHQILRKSRQESVRKGLRFFADRELRKSGPFGAVLNTPEFF